MTGATEWAPHECAGMQNLSTKKAIQMSSVIKLLQDDLPMAELLA